MNNNSENKEEVNNDQDHTSYRNMLIETEQRISEQFDKTILTIAGGALAISLAFIKDVIGNGVMQAGWLLIISWASLTICLVLILVSFYSSLLAYRKAQDQVDNKTIKNETPGGHFSKIVSISNAAGILLLCVGLVTLFIFAYENLSKENENGSKTYTSTKTNSPNTKPRQTSIHKGLTSTTTKTLKLKNDKQP